MTFGPRAGGGALFDRAMGVGTQHGLPDEIERVEIDPAGTVIARVATEVSSPGGAGTLDWELTGVGWTYSITTELRTQTPFVAAIDPYYVARGSIRPVAGGRTLKIVQTDAEGQHDYFTPMTAPGWLRIAGIGRQGATGWTAVPTGGRQRVAVVGLGSGPRTRPPFPRRARSVDPKGYRACRARAAATPTARPTGPGGRAATSSCWPSATRAPKT